MRGFDPAKKKAKPFANGGPVRGPGTGTSDEVPDEVPEGTYVMPADSTQAVGQDQLAALGTDANGVPVNLSNGEFTLPPEQVHAVGVQALNQMKDATHQPMAPRGFAPEAAQESPEPRMFFADGGVVQDEKKRPTDTPPGVAKPAGAVTTPAPTSPSNVWPQSRYSPGQRAAATAAAPAFSDPSTIPGQDVAPGQVPQRPAPAPAAPPNAALEAQRQSDQAKIGAAWDTLKDVNDDAGRAIADVATLVPRGLAGAYDTAVVRPLRAAGANLGYISPSLVPDGVDPSSMTPFTDQKRMQQVAGAPAPAVGSAGPAASAPPAPAAPSANRLANAPAPGAQPAPAVAQAPAAPVAAAQAEGATPTDGTINGFAPVAGLNGVYRRGNEYTDSPGGGTTARGLPPALSVGNLNAIGNGGFGPAPQMAERGSGPQVTIIPDTRRAEQERRDMVRTLTTPVQGARGLTAAQRNGLLTLMNQEQQAQQAADRNATALQQTEMQTGAQRDMALMREVGDTGRASMREQGENTRAGARNAIDTGRLDLDRQARGLEIRSGERQEKLYQRYEAAKTPEERVAIAQQIRDLSGKATNPRDDLMVVGGGQEWDSTANVMRNVPQRVFDARARQFVDAGQGQQQAVPPGYKDTGERTPTGAPIYVDAKGGKIVGK